MNIVEATREYEKWLAKQTDVIAADIRRKHGFMANGTFPFLSRNLLPLAAIVAAGRKRALAGAKGPRCR